MSETKAAEKAGSTSKSRSTMEVHAVSKIIGALDELSPEACQRTMTYVSGWLDEKHSEWYEAKRAKQNESMAAKIKQELEKFLDRHADCDEAKPEAAPEAEVPAK